MERTQNTVEWREALALLERVQQAPESERASMLDRLCEAHPAAEVPLRLLAQSLQQAQAESFLTGAALSKGLVGAARAGSVCGRWKLQSPLGSGGMGEVWLARRNDGLHEGMAAIKLLHAGPRTALTQARFAAEGRVLARLEHPHIARLLDVGIDNDGQRYIVLEHVAGLAITAWCSERHTPLAGRLELFLQVCDAVAHAHAQLVVHRDIKPSNILVTADGQAKLLDFGIAKLLDDEGGELTRAGLPALTPEYAAPEQLLGGPISVATDVHALGGLLFELLTGARPQADARASPEQRLRATLDGVTRRPSQVAESALAPLLRGDLDHIVEHALHKLPADRYPSVRALADDVQRHLRDEAVSVRAASWRYRLLKFTRRHRAGVLAGSFAVLALLVGSGAALWQAGQARTEAAVANATREFLLGLFKTIDVGTTGTRPALDRPVRDLLIDSSEQLLSNRELSPTVRLDLLSTIGRLHARLSLLDSADRLEVEALSLAREVHGPDSDVTLQAMLERGGTLSQLGRRAEALAMLNEVVTRTERTGRAQSLVHVRAVHEVGESAFYAEDERAEPFLVRAVAAYARHHPLHEERVYAHVALMRLYLQREDFTAFETEAAHTEALVRETAGTRPYDRFYLDRILAARWLAVGDYKRAQDFAQSAMPFGVAALGERHPHIHFQRRRLALLEGQLGDRVTARAQLASLDDAVQDRAVWTSQEESRDRADMAWLDGDLEVAHRSALRDLSTPHTVLSEQLERLMRLAEIESLRGAHALAVAAARAAYDGLGNKPGVDTLKHAQARAVLAEALLAAGEPELAREQFLGLLAWGQTRQAIQVGPIVGRLQVRAWLGLSGLYRASDPVAAQGWAVKALESLSASAPVLDDRLLWAAARLAEAQAFQATGRRQPALLAAQSAVTLLQRDQATVSPRLVHAKAVLATLR